MLLLAMPDTMPGFSHQMSRWPNLALSSLAGNAPGHDVLVGDLCVKQENIVAGALQAIEEHKPDIVGLTAMSFQYYTAKRVAEEIQKRHPDLPLALGGYHGTLAHEGITGGEDGRLFSYIFRGEGEATLAEFLDAVEKGRPLEGVKGISFRQNGKRIHNERRDIPPLDQIRLPKRSSRIWSGYKIYHHVVDMVETSRGCTMPCNFCCISKMYGRIYRAYPIERVIADIADAKKHGATLVAFIDDNITLEVEQFGELCDAIVKAGLNDLAYFTQASCAGIASSPELARKMARAGFRIVFLGVENVSPRNLKFMQKGQIAEKSRMAIRYLQDSNIAIAGGMIVGNPEDREEDIAANYDFFLDNGVEIYHDQILTPYIQTPLREELLQQGLVTNPDDFRYYSGYWANVRTRHLSSDQIQFLRWKYRGRNMRAFLRRVRPPFRQKKSLLELIYHLIYLPLLELYRKWQNRGKTEQEVYREYIRRTWRRHQFFHDKPPSPHLRILYDDAAVADLHSESETAAR